MIVVDSTVITAWGVETPWSGEAARLLAEEETLIAPQIALIQAWGALRQLHADGHITREAYQRLAMLLPAGLAGIAADHQLMPEASDLAAEFNLKPEPALCLALAQARKARLATADPSLADRACVILAPDHIIRLNAATKESTASSVLSGAEETAGERPEKQKSLTG